MSTRAENSPAIKVDYFKKMTELHTDMVNSIKELMRKREVKKVDLS